VELESRPIAVVLDGAPTPAWQARALAALQSSPALDVVEVSTTGYRPRGLVRRLHAAAERHMFHLGADALAPVNLPGAPSERESGQARLPQAPGGGEAGQASRTLAPSRPASLLVWLSARPAPADERRYVLYTRHAGRFESPDAFVRAVLTDAGWVETEVLLQSAGHTRVIDRTVSGVRPFSTTLSRDFMLWKLAPLISRAAERAPGLGLPAPAAAAVDRAPSGAALIAHPALTWPRALATHALFRRPWAIRVRRRGPRPTEGWQTGGELVRWRRGHLYADPFLFQHQGRHHLFCEEIPLGARRAVISHTELRLDGGLADPPVPVLQRPYHLSYPFVFAHDGGVFMIPETHAVRRVELYRAVDFPHTWRPEAVLLEDLAASDATLLFHGDRIWLFAAVAAPDASGLDELHLFWAQRPQGPWHRHPCNPVVSDVRCARPAGAILRWGSRLVRPGQDGSRRYGGAVSFRAIDMLSTTAYAEHEIARLGPSDLGGPARATHTYAADERFEAVDLRRRELRLGTRLRRRTRSGAAP
jgi:hypothetical protein